MIICLTGFIGSGKGTAGHYMVKKHDYQTTSFANSLKDSVASMFRWSRELLEGDTAESREWREQVDPWWSKHFGRPVTPRWALQYFGTDVVRMHFHTNMWIWSVERQILDYGDRVVVTDARFPNEVNLIREMGGKVIWIRRPELPEWYDAALAQNQGHGSEMSSHYSHVHPSEWAWIGTEIDATIMNDGTIDDLERGVDRCLATLS
jgi:hypothetical protein